MFVRLLHGALALSLATEPAAAGDEPASAAPAESRDDANTAEPDDAAAPKGDAAAPEADAPAPEADASDTDALEASAADRDAPAPEVDASTPEPQADPSASETAATEGNDEPVATAPIVATEAPRPIVGPPPSGRNDDIVSKALLGGGIASLTLTAGLVGTSAWAWTESNRADRASKNLTGDTQANAQDRRDQMRTIGLITTGAAALYGTTGVVLLLLRSRDRKQPPRTVLAPSPGGLSLTGRF